MVGIFRECIVIAQNYFGNIFWFLLYAASFVYLFVYEKDRTKRMLLLYVPLLVFLAFFIPPVRMVYVALFDEGNTYYRLLWLLPFCVTCAYAGTQAVAKHRRIGMVLLAVLVVLAGKPVYKSIYLSRAENAYHLPQHAIEICDLIRADAEEHDAFYYDTDLILAAFPASLVHYVRQYDTNLVLPFGREVVEPAWNHWNNVYTVMEEDEIIYMEILTNLLQVEGYRYLVLEKDRKTDRDPATSGYELIGERGNYHVYRYG